MIRPISSLHTPFEVMLVYDPDTNTGVAYRRSSSCAGGCSSLNGVRFGAGNDVGVTGFVRPGEKWRV